MSLLAPLYIAGLVAVSLPIVFHLIRRTPRGQVPFSSLMFLTPSPPRITRRSRLNNILLLLLRGAVLSLLAFAFARPLLRSAESLEIGGGSSRRVAIVLDRSASMRRGDLWQQAVARCRQQLAGLAPTDQAVLIAFDDRVTTLLDWRSWQQTPPEQRLALAEAKLRDLAPSWGGTALGEAVVHAADMLLETAEGATTHDANAHDATREIFLVTDLQQGARLDALQAYAWPPGVTLDAQIVRTGSGTNAGLHLSGESLPAEFAADAAELRSGKAAAGLDAIRCRVCNEPDARSEQFTLHWHTAAGLVPDVEPLTVHVPAGASRVVRVARPTRAAQADRLVLSGDDYDFDNTLFLTPPHSEEVTVALFGSDPAEDTQGLRYFLERALVETPRRKVRLVAVAPDQPLDPAVAQTTRLAVVAEPPPADQAEELRRYLAAGGKVLLPLVTADSAALQSLVGDLAPKVAEADAGTFALLGEVDYRHPLFAPFADPRFSDFTKIHFWKHRVLRLPVGDDGQTHAWRVVARFDGGDPAIIEHTSGSGRLLVLASTWRPVDSQLALSSKFVPLLAALLDRPDANAERSQFDTAEFGAPAAGADTAEPGGRNGKLPPVPGIYELGGRRIAVNIPADESLTARLGVEELEQRGAKLGGEARRQTDVELRRQLLVTELENRQKLWQWLIVAALVLVIAETALAGRISRQMSQVNA